MVRKMMAGALVLVAVSLASGRAFAGKTIAILLSSSEARDVDPEKSALAVLRAAGFAEPDTTYVIENAEGNKTKALELAKKLAATPYSLVVTFGTSASVSMAKELKVSPMVFGYVYDPVETKIVLDWKFPGGNITGVSNKGAVTAVLAPLKKLGNIKTLAVLFAQGEKNSEAQLKDLQHAQTETGITVVAVPATHAEDVQHFLGEALAGSDAVYITGGVPMAAVPTIVDAAAKAHKPSVTHLSDLVDKGVLFSVSADPVVIGQRTGELCVRVLKGEKPGSLPILLPEKLDVVLNTKTAKAYALPPEFLSLVSKKVE